MPRARSAPTSPSRRVRSPTAARSAATGRSSGLLIPGLVFIAAVLVWRIWPCSGSACVKNAEVGWVLASLAAPTALIAGFPLEGGSVRLALAGVGAVVLWMALGALGRPAQRPLPRRRLARVVARVPVAARAGLGRHAGRAGHHALPGALTRRSHLHQLSQRVEAGRADALHVGQVVDLVERAVRLPVGDDGPGRRGTDTRQRVEVGLGRRVEVDRCGRRDAAARRRGRGARRSPWTGAPRPGAGPAPAARRSAGWRGPSPGGRRPRPGRRPR